MRAVCVWGLVLIGCGSAGPTTRTAPTHQASPSASPSASQEPEVALAAPPSRLGVACVADDGCGGELVCRRGCPDDLTFGLIRGGELDCDAPVGFCGHPRAEATLDARHAMLIFAADHPYAIVGALQDERVEVPARFLGHGDALQLGAPLDGSHPLVGARVILYGESGPVCEASVEAPWAVGQDSESRGDGEAEEHAVGDMLDFALSDAFERGGLMRALRLRPEGDCRGALWARPADAPPAPFAALTVADAPARVEALRRVRGLPVYALLQQARDAQDPDAEPGEWTEEAELAVHTFALVGHDHVLVTAHWGAPCESAEFDLNALYRLVPSGDWELLTLDIDGRAAPRLVLDPDRDGRLEILGERGLLRWIRSPFVRSASRIGVRAIPC